MKIVIGVFRSALSGCCAVSTQRKFEGERDYWVGQRLADPFFAMFIQRAEGNRELGDGNVEYFYAEGKCKYAIVINNRTRIVESWSYLSEPEYCAMSNCGAW